MRLRKACAATVFTMILAAQVYVSLPPGRSKKYWPFVDYPMYSDVKRSGDTFEERELRLQPCERGRDPMVVANRDLGVTPYRFFALLDDVHAPEGGEDVERLLTRFLASRTLQGYCSAQVWRKTFTMGSRGLEDRNPPWEMVHQWSVSEARETDGPR